MGNNDDDFFTPGTGDKIFVADFTETEIDGKDEYP